MQCVYCALYVNLLYAITIWQNGLVYNTVHCPGYCIPQCNAEWWINHIFNGSLWVFVKWHEKYYRVNHCLLLKLLTWQLCRTFIVALRFLPVWSESETSLYLHCMVLLTVNYPKHQRHWPREEADDSTTTKCNMGTKESCMQIEAAQQALLYQSFGLVILLL